MNEEYAKHLIENSNEGPITLWLKFVLVQIGFGLLLMGIIGLCLWVAS